MAFGRIQPRRGPAGAAPKVDKRFKAGSSVDVWINSKAWVPVKSSNVSQIMYDRPRKRLYVRFKGGGEYFYANVTVLRAKQFFQTGSMGKEVWKLRRTGYAGYRVTSGFRARTYRAHR